MAENDYITRSEFARLQDRVDKMNTSGSKDLAILALQIQELAKDLSAHEIQHREEHARLVSTRRWFISTAVAAVAAIGSSNIGIWVSLVTHH